MPPQLYYKKVKKTDMQQHVGKKFSIPGSYWNGSTPEEQEELYPIEVVKIDAAHKFKGIRNAEPAFGFVLTRPEDQEHNPEGATASGSGSRNTASSSPRGRRITRRRRRRRRRPRLRPRSRRPKLMRT